MAADTAPGPGAGTVQHARATVRPDKARTVAELAEALRSSAATVLTDYRGLTVKQVTDLRVALGVDTTYSVVKNTLTRLAATDAGLDELQELLVGPTAIAFVNGDPVAAAKGLRDFARTNPALVVKGGVLDGRSLSAQEIARLADLESREVLLAKLAGAMKASLTQAVYLLNAPLAQAARLAAALQAKAEQDPSVIGGPGEAPASPAPQEATEPELEPTPAAAVEATAPDAAEAAAEAAPETDTTPETPDTGSGTA